MQLDDFLKAITAVIVIVTCRLCANSIQINRLLRLKMSGAIYV